MNEKKLLVINNESKFIVMTAEDILVCLRLYATEKNMDNFRIEEGKPNYSLLTEKQKMYKGDRIMFVSIIRKEKE